LLFGKSTNGSDTVLLGSCPVNYDLATKRYIFTEKVTACGGTPSTTADYINFAHQVSKAKTTKVLGGKSLTVDSEIDVNLVCRYSSTVTVHSNYNVTTIQSVKKLALQVSVVETIRSSNLI